MENKTTEPTRRFIDAKGRRRERIFNEEIYPLIEEIISGVFLSLKINFISQDDKNDIKQEIYLKVLTRLKTKGFKGVRSFKNYYFITIKNFTIDYLRAQNREKQLYEFMNNLISNLKRNGSTKNRNKTDQE